MIAILKPTYLCNLRCKYCYIGETEKAKAHKWASSDAIKYINEIFNAAENRKEKFVVLIWHGGEPLIWGEKNFSLILDYIASIKRKYPFAVRNIIQTNLTLISQEYINLFVRHNVHVSFSIDGPKEINDLTRTMPNCNGSFDVITRNVKLCINSGLKLSCVVVGNKNHIGRIPELFSFMNSLGLRNFKFNPIFDNGDQNFESFNIGITPNEYAEMVIQLFDLWYTSENSKVSESNLVEICSNIITRKPKACNYLVNCQNVVFAISPLGEVFPCGRFCEENGNFCIGNLQSCSLIDLLCNNQSSVFADRNKLLKEGECKDCPYFDICNGGCPHDAYSYTNNIFNRTFLCKAYKRIFDYLSNVLQPQY